MSIAIPLLCILLYVGMWLWSVTTLIRGLRTPKPLKHGATCGVCGHEVGARGTAGTASRAVVPDRCPECGTEYIIGGICTVYSTVRNRAGLPGLLAAWTVVSICLAIAVAFGQHALDISTKQIVGSRYRLAGPAIYTPIRPQATRQAGTPSYELHVQVDLRVDVETGYARRGHAGAMEIRGELRFAFQSGGERIEDVVFLIAPGAELSAVDAIAYIEAAGLSADDPVLAFEAQQLRQIVTQWRDEPTVTMMSAPGTPMYGRLGPAVAWNRLQPMLDAAGEPVGGLQHTFSGVQQQHTSMRFDTSPVWYVAIMSVAYAVCVLV